MTIAVDEPYDRQREEHARDLLRTWAVAASNAGCPPAFVARMRTFADMHDRHAVEAAQIEGERSVDRELLGRWLFERDYGERGLATPDVATWDEYVEKNQEEWRREADVLLDFMRESGVAQQVTS